MINQLIQHPYIIMIITIIIGIGFGSIIGVECTKQNCKQYFPPPSNFSNATVRWKSQCFQITKINEPSCRQHENRIRLKKNI